MPNQHDKIGLFVHEYVLTDKKSRIRKLGDGKAFIYHLHPCQLDQVLPALSQGSGQFLQGGASVDHHPHLFLLLWLGLDL